MGQQRRRERDVDKDIHDAIVEEATDPEKDHSAAEIHRKIVDKFPGREIPSLRTTQRIIKDIRGPKYHKARERWKLLDSSFQWHKMEEYGLPWEATDFVLEIIRHYKNQIVKELRMEKRISKKDGSSLDILYTAEGEAYRPSAPGEPIFLPIDQTEFVPKTLKDVPEYLKKEPTARTMVWAWRIHQAMRGVANLRLIISLASDLAIEERIYEALGRQMNLDTEVAMFAYKPWLNKTRRMEYEEAIEKGIIQRHLVSDPIYTGEDQEGSNGDTQG